MTRVLPAHWRASTLDAVCSSLSDGDHLAPPKAERGVPFITISAMNDGNVSLEKATRFVPRSYYERLSDDRRARSGDILLSVTGSLGIAAPVITNEPFVFQRHIAVLRPDPQAVDNRFLLYFLRSAETREGLAEGSTGTAQMTIALGTLRRFTIPLPPLAEQRRIVARIEALFARTRRARADLKRIAALSAKHRRAILAREYGGERASSAAQHRFVPLGECVNDFTYGTAVRCSRDLAGTPVLRIPNVAAGRIALDDLKFAVLPKREQQKLALAIGDILIVRSNGSPELVGRPAMVERPAAGMAFAGYLIRARPRLDRVEPTYLLHMLSSPNVRETIELNARSSSGVHNVNAAELAALKVPLPSLSEQQQAVRRIKQAIDHALIWEADATCALALLDRLEQSILARAFRGELVSHMSITTSVSSKPAAHSARRRLRVVA